MLPTAVLAGILISQVGVEGCDLPSICLRSDRFSYAVRRLHLSLSGGILTYYSISQNCL